MTEWHARYSGPGVMIYLACRTQSCVHLLPVEDLLFVGGGSHDLRALTPLFYNHVNPYGTFHLDMNSRLDLDQPSPP
jgi:hypothetical protein